MLVDFTYVGQDRPPDYEFTGLVSGNDWKALETLDEAMDKKRNMSSKWHKEEINHDPYWHKESRLSQEECDKLLRAISV